MLAEYQNMLIPNKTYFE